jgi:hypothetical protein
MNSYVNCPGCGFRGRLPDELAGLKTIVCPQCKTAVQVDQLRRHAMSAQDETYPIWVDGTPGPRPAPAEPCVLPAPPEEESYVGDYMKDEAARFAQYVAARLSELHGRRLELAEAENRFESMTMERKQELHRQHGAVVAEAEQLRQREAALQAKEAGLVAREGELATRQAEVAAREGRVARAENRAADTDRRTAGLRAAIDQLEARRAAVAEERETLNRRAEELDRAELALHRRSAELDELDERLRLEQEEFDREREQARSA